MKLSLPGGLDLRGRAFGAERNVRGEVVFSTGMTGYVETLTDPSYRGQLLVLTYPLQGNYGVPPDGWESGRIQVQGLIVSRYSADPSHHQSVRSLGEWLREQGIPAIEGVDTRALTRRLRDAGTVPGTLGAEDAVEFDEVEMATVAEQSAPAEVVRYVGGDLRLLVIDTGAKENIFRSLQRRGASLIRAPLHRDWAPYLDEVDGVVLPNGPGDPADLLQLVEAIRERVLSRGLPTFGICLGHQLLALAGGARTYKLRFGHRSQNQPVQDRTTLRAYLTSQNHGFAVDEASLGAEWLPWFVNLNDGTNEGIRHGYRPFRSVQFHPEGSPGPKDTSHLFDDFLRMVGELRKSRPHAGQRTRLPTVAT